MKLFYLPTLNKFVGKHGLYTPQEVDQADRLEKEWKQNQVHYSLSQLLDIFPEMKPAVKKKLQAEIKQCKADMVRSEQVRVNFNNKILSKVKYENKWFYSMVRDILYVEPLTESREKRIKRNYFFLSALKSKFVKVTDSNVAEADIIRAREVPLTTFIEVNRAGFAQCPWHTDITPSLKVYQNTNRWYCFSCHAGTDVIDFIIKRDNCQFLEAIKTLCPVN